MAELDKSDDGQEGWVGFTETKSGGRTQREPQELQLSNRFGALQYASEEMGGVEPGLTVQPIRQKKRDGNE